MRYTAVLLALIALPAAAQQVQPEPPSRAAQVCGQMATQWAMSLIEQDKQQAMIVDLTAQLVEARKLGSAQPPEPQK
jgi:hypothetical protein